MEKEMVLITQERYEKMVFELKNISEERCTALCQYAELALLRQFKKDVMKWSKDYGPAVSSVANKRFTEICEANKEGEE